MREREVIVVEWRGHLILSSSFANRKPWQSHWIMLDLDLNTTVDDSQRFIVEQRR